MAQKRKPLRILFIMDPLEKLDPRWDNSLALAREFMRRGLRCWTADIPDMALKNSTVRVSAKELEGDKALTAKKRAAGPQNIETFDLALIRKEPPFDMAYYAMTLILEHARIPVLNHPRGIRDANEKMWGLQFQRLMPETLISSSPQSLLDFMKQFKDGCVIKPLNEKGGRGIFRLDKHSPSPLKKIKEATSGGRTALVCQRFLKNSGGIDKRIVILDGKILCAFEKHPSPKDFRANLGLGASAHPTQLNPAELKIVRTLAKPLRQAGLFLAGLDVMGGKLLEVNVTSPAGMTDAEALDPKKKWIAAWADWLESFTRKRV